MPQDIIFETFSRLTKGLNPQRARIVIFEYIRDIPYAIIPALRDPSAGPQEMLKLDKGSCQPKHYLLGMFFNQLDIPIKYATFPFSWAELPLNYPPILKNIAAKLPQGFHLCCEAYIEEKWILVDATWDVALKKAGFPVNEYWDGITSTVNAVIAQTKITHTNAQERWDYQTQKRSLLSSGESDLYAKFIKKFNQWLEELRRS